MPSEMQSRREPTTASLSGSSPQDGLSIDNPTSAAGGIPVRTRRRGAHIVGTFQRVPCTSVVEQELPAVEQRPGQVLQALLAGVSAFDDGDGVLPLGTGRRAAEGHLVQRRDRLLKRHLVLR